MNLPGLLIEYLINGAIILSWLSLLFAPLVGIDANGSEILLIPIAYVIGMFIDYIALIATLPAKQWIRNRARMELSEELSFEKDDYKDMWNEKLMIEKDYPDLKRESRSRSSRDRIARGTIINLLLITAFFWSSIHVYGLILIVVACLMWHRIEKQSYSYEVRAAHSLRTQRDKEHHSIA